MLKIKRVSTAKIGSTAPLKVPIKKEFVTKDILFMADTSGLVSDSDLARVLKKKNEYEQQCNMLCATS